MAKAKRKKEPFSWKKFWVRFVITLSTVAVLGVVVPIGISYAAHDRVARNGIYDKHGNLKNGGWTFENITARIKDGYDTAVGWLSQQGNHSTGNGFGANADIARGWQKQKGKLSKEQLHGGWSGPLGKDSGADISQMGLYKYAGKIGIDPKAYKSDRALLNAVTNRVTRKSNNFDK